MKIEKIVLTKISLNFFEKSNKRRVLSSSGESLLFWFPQTSFLFYLYFFFVHQGDVPSSTACQRIQVAVSYVNGRAICIVLSVLCVRGVGFRTLKPYLLVDGVRMVWYTLLIRYDTYNAQCCIRMWVAWRRVKLLLAIPAVYFDTRGWGYSLSCFVCLFSFYPRVLPVLFRPCIKYPKCRLNFTGQSVT